MVVVKKNILVAWLAVTACVDVGLPGSMEQEPAAALPI